MTQRVTCAVLTVSDRCAAGEVADQSGPLLVRLLEQHLEGAEVVDTKIVPDEVARIAEAVREWSDRGIGLILTTGGTGFAPHDRTPEAIRPLLEREAPGIVAAMLLASLTVTPHAMLSRPVAGIRGQSLVVTLPGSPKGAQENLEALLPALAHGLALLVGTTGEDRRHQHYETGHEEP